MYLFIKVLITMKTIQVESLSQEAFKSFGTYANLINPAGERLGAKPVEFFRDQLQLDVNGALPLSYSCCRVEKREYVINILEYHTSCCEAVLPLDNDILLQVGPATVNGDEIPYDRIRVFYVPQGTVVTLRPDVWHWGPFTVNDKPANILINLPERTYANDCVVKELSEKDWMRIEL
ncbi:DUF4867 family protein [Carboxylicivirga mesophila]|uniref:DUF4867 family protein n=1 Tax=Carboxylicivirga mesophila TaxID=1166478 RepID=A0ABS5KCK2_9BACT|nr:DUF4867 family protein [Carboxylicivirga mesophila]MBS2212681.1 DUF4867 family protein [Carboxylicivirga mesophila]